MSSYGEVGFPYGAITGDAATCLNTTETFSEIASPGSTTNFYLDSTFTTSSPNLFTSFTTPGTHEVMLLTTANLMVDTAILLVEVYEQPVVDFSFSILDTILCHKEPLEINLDTTEQFVQYWLFDTLFTQDYGVSGVGTGAPLTFTTDSLSQTGTYFLQAEHTLGNCEVDFTIPIEVTVEQTKAAYHSTIINASVGEQVTIMENCTDADNYAWTFTPSASPGTSTLSDPLIAFGSPGTTIVDLICWSNNFCYDSIVGSGPFIFVPPTVTDSCWINEKRGSQPSWPGFYIDDMADLCDVNDGYLLTGSYSADTLESQHGMNVVINNGTFTQSRGGFMAKFDYDGTVKWVIHDQSLGSALTVKGLITDAETDSQGNIYICGHNLHRFFDNAGDSIQFTGSYLMKLDSLGRYQWHSRTTASSSTYNYRKNMYIAIDQDDNIYWGGMETSYYIEPDGNIITFSPSGSNYLKVMKIAPNGNYVWHTGLNLLGELEELEVDDNMNLYTAGVYSQTLNIYSSGSAQIAYTHNGSTSYKTFVAKWDSTGQFLWCSRITMSGQNGGGNYSEHLTYPRDLYVEPSTGEVYVTGRTHFGYLSNRFLVTNTIGVTDTLGIGGLYLAKFQTNGNLDWAAGTNMLSSNSPSPYGCGEEVFVENDTACLAGVIRNNSTNLSGGGTTINISSEMDNFFVVRLESNGLLLDLLKSGDNINEINASEPSIQGFFRNDGAYFAARNASLYGAAVAPVEFGDTVISHDVLGWVDKFYEPCGTLYLSGYSINDAASICPGDNYTFPDGYTETNIMGAMTHISYFTASNGIDSMIYTTLSINPTFITSVNDDVCYGGSYILPGGTTLTNITANYSDTALFMTMAGCDSSVYTNINVLPIFTETLNLNICNGSDYTFPNGITLTNILTDVSDTSLLVASTGCDSTVISNLIVLNTYEEVVNDNVCEGDSYILPNGTTLNNILTDVSDTSLLVASTGCDSTVISNLTVLNTYEVIVGDNVCEGDSYIFPSGSTQTNITTSMSDTSFLISATGCDSSIITNLSVTYVNTTVTEASGILNSAQGGASYVWLDCDNGYAEAVPAGYGQSYTVTSSGNYAVAISLNGCTDSSACTYMNLSELQEVEKFYLIEVYPNPSKGFIHVVNRGGVKIEKLRIYDLCGKLVHEQAVSQQEFDAILNGRAGMYFLHLYFEDNQQHVVHSIKQD